MKPLYHYTIGPKLPLIRKSAALLPLGKNLGESEIPMLWFSSRTDFEPTAIKTIMRNGHFHRLTFDEMHAMFGCYRFRLNADIALLPFGRACKQAKTPQRAIDIMLRNGMEWGGNPADWYATKADIPLLALEFEKWSENEWRPSSFHLETIKIIERGQRAVMLSAA